MILSRRNWLVKVSILINVCVVFYVAVHINQGYAPQVTANSLTSSGQGQQQQQQALRRDLTSIDSAVFQDGASVVVGGPEVGGSARSVGAAGGNESTGAVVTMPPPVVTTLKSQRLCPDCTGTSTPSSDKTTTGEEPRAIPCQGKKSLPRYVQRGPYWVLHNYIPGQRAFACDESITYTTHGDFSFLDNLEPLCERWGGPVSVAVYAPGSDFEASLAVIQHLHQCSNTNLIRDLVSFHLYFDQKHFPPKIPRPENALLNTTMVNCSQPAPWSNLTTYRRRKGLTYPVNVGRNVARENAHTHYILPSDIELYPSPNLIPDFLAMIRRGDKEVLRPAPKVFVMSIFEVEESSRLPEDKKELIRMLKKKSAIPFHQKVCAECHKIPKAREWMVATVNPGLHVFHIGKRHKPYHHWEPIFIGTNQDPVYDERLSWEGKSDKMTQGFALCVLDYEFHILDNAFLVHRPGIKKNARDPKRQAIASKQTSYIRKIIFPELKRLYGTKPGCII